MITLSQKADGSSGPAKVEKKEESRGGKDRDDACRCKETSQMTPRELLRLMMSDLSIWKKIKKG